MNEICSLTLPSPCLCKYHCCRSRRASGAIICICSNLKTRARYSWRTYMAYTGMNKQPALSIQRVFVCSTFPSASSYVFLVPFRCTRRWQHATAIASYLTVYITLTSCCKCDLIAVSLMLAYLILPYLIISYLILSYCCRRLLQGARPEVSARLAQHVDHFAGGRLSI